MIVCSTSSRPIRIRSLPAAGRASSTSMERRISGFAGSRARWRLWYHRGDLRRETNANTIGVCVRHIERALAISVVAFVVAYVLSQWAIRELPLGWTLNALLSRLDLDHEISI